MDDLDHRIIVELQIDPRKSNKHLTMSLGVANATVTRRIEHLVSSGSLILTALPDLGKFGYSVHVLIFLQTERSKSHEIAERLCQIPNLRYVSTCVGFADLFLRGDFTSTETLADFITGYLVNVNGITRIETMLEYKEIKRTHERIEISHPTRKAASQTGDIAISEADRRLILELQKNARAPLKALAYAVGLSETTIHRRIKELVGSGAIELTALPNAAMTGYSARGLIMIKTELSKISLVADSVARYPQVNYVGLLSGPIQIQVGINASSPEGLVDFVSQDLNTIEGITRVAMLTSLNVLKRNFTWLYDT